MSTIETDRHSESDRPSEVVVDAVAEFTDADPMDLTPPLYEVLDPDALDALLESMGGSDTDGRVEFNYNGCHVEVCSSGEISVSLLD